LPRARLLATASETHPLLQWPKTAFLQGWTLRQRLPTEQRIQRLQTRQTSKSTKPKLSTYHSLRSPTTTLSNASIYQTEVSRTADRLEAILDDAFTLLDSPNPPKEEAILEFLTTCEDLARYFKRIPDSPGLPTKNRVTPAQNLLFLDERDESPEPRTQPATAVTSAIRENAVKRLSVSAYQIITSPNVFITPKILESYVNIQSLLERPETLSHVFTLYAHKPVPIGGTSSVRFMAAKPNKTSSAVSLKIANAALSVAIQAKNLPLCLDIINSTVCTTAFRRAKILTNALLPLSALVLAPLAIYSLASQLVVFQDTMSPEMATNIAFAGIFSYVAFTGTIGLVAMTTANDQMDRVTWALGMPLRDRWLREEERAMLDRVAGAWGFKESARRGEEEGYDWEALKEFSGLRGMVLDRVSLMDGME
jgi:hypothetical protein